jgi:hypothetical protein
LLNLTTVLTSESARADFQIDSPPGTRGKPPCLAGATGWFAAESRRLI